MAGTTSRGYPYPQLSDPVDQLTADFQALAEAINTDVGTIVSDRTARVRVVAQSTQTVAHNSIVAIQFGSGSEIYDPKGWHDTSTNNTRVTPNIEGWYELGGVVALGGRTDWTNLQAWIRTAGANSIPGAGKPVISSTQLNGTVMIPVVPALVYLNGSTDYVEIVTQQTNGASAAAGTAASFQFVSVLEVKLATR